MYDQIANVQKKIRISAIDSPEKKQAFGQDAKKTLSDLCFDKTVEIKYIDTDRYGRTVADVACGGIDAGAYMVGKGMAWVYDKYSSGHEFLYPIQQQAKAATLGLWGYRPDLPAVAPWEWRKLKNKQTTPITE
ncbi:thermonuclease family protein [Ephemeroptericola cinctiostellae]|uniref:thermonuclease family protein n=1 Tax=Ephemeroptericola cinctiostellae TaxID=2268024 RepID=UPI001CEFAEB5|nr:thermonuclease family protein [Ephemeroptericola cinctiostellae]